MVCPFFSLIKDVRILVFDHRDRVLEILELFKVPSKNPSCWVIMAIQKHKLCSSCRTY